MFCVLCLRAAAVALQLMQVRLLLFGALQNVESDRQFYQRPVLRECVSSDTVSIDRDKTQCKIQDNIIHPLRKWNVCYNTYYTNITEIAPMAHILTLPNYNPLLQQGSHSLPNILPFYPRPSSSPHPHLLPMRVALICLLVDCVSERPLEWTTVGVKLPHYGQES